jgi:hypothetical protein
MTGRLAVWILVGSLVAAGAAFAGELRKSGACKLQRGESPFDKAAFAVTLGNAEVDVTDKTRNLVGATAHQTQLDESAKSYPKAALASVTSYEIVVYTAPPKLR